MAVSPAKQKRRPHPPFPAQTKPGPSGAAYSGARACLTQSPCVVIVGGGFAGIEVARALRDSPARVILIDRHNYTLFQPLLYQVATAALSSADVAAPIRGLLRAANTEVLLDEVIGVDCERSCARTSGGREIDFTLLVLATGSQYGYFGHNEWAALAPALKTLKDAVTIRSRLLLAFEQAEMCADDVERRALMTFVVIGAGPTGVEMAGAISELAKTTLARDFRRIEPASARILLIEADSKVLGAFPAKLGTYAQRALTRLGIQVMLNAKVEKIDENGVVAGGQIIDAKTVIWGAGVADWLGVQSGPHGSVRVNPDFSIAAHSHIFVIGDAAAASGMDGKPLPHLAAVAKQEGKYVGDLTRQRIAGAEPTNVFRNRDYGTMATIGRSAAVADLRGVRLTGTVAWLLWGFAHIYFLIGFRNRLLVFVNWCWAWLTYARGSRLITRDEKCGSSLNQRRFPKDSDEPSASTLSEKTRPASANVAKATCPATQPPSLA